MLKINDINARLKRANLGIAVYQLGDRLYLRATLPPKPSSTLRTPHQQWLSLGINKRIFDKLMSNSDRPKPPII